MEHDMASLKVTVSRDLGRAEANAALHTLRARPRGDNWPVAHHGADNTGGLRARNRVVAGLLKTKLTATFDRHTSASWAECEFRRAGNED